MSEHLVRLTEAMRKTGLGDRSGKLLYSSLPTLAAGPVYLLGYNPGGEPDHETTSILSHLHDAGQAATNEYLDVAWQTRTCSWAVGEAPLQRRVKYLLTGIGLDVRSVCASNLIFVRSRGEKHLASAAQMATACWPVHRLILDIVRPTMILTFGRKVADFIVGKAEKSKLAGSKLSGHGNWECFANSIVLNGRSISLVSLPHLSRYNINGHAEVIAWVKTEMTIPS